MTDRLVIWTLIISDSHVLTDTDLSFCTSFHSSPLYSAFACGTQYSLLNPFLFIFYFYTTHILEVDMLYIMNVLERLSEITLLN